MEFLIDILHNLGNATQGANTNDWLPWFFGGTAGSIGNILRQGIHNTVEQENHKERSKNLL